MTKKELIEEVLKEFGEKYSSDGLMVKPKKKGAYWYLGSLEGWLDKNLSAMYEKGREEAFMDLLVALKGQGVNYEIALIVANTMEKLSKPISE